MVGVFIPGGCGVLFLVGLFVAKPLASTTFLGAFYEHTLVFNGTGPADPTPEWALFDQVKVGDRLVAINGMPVTSAREFTTIERSLSRRTGAGDRRAGGRGEPARCTVTLNSFPQSSRTVYFVIPAILSAVFLAASLWIFGLRRTEPAGRAFSLFTSSLAIVTGTYFNLVTTHQFTVMWTAAAAISCRGVDQPCGHFPSGAAFYHQSSIPALERDFAWIGAFCFRVPHAVQFRTTHSLYPQWRYIYGFMALSVVVYIVMNLYHAIYAQSPVVKTQSRTILDRDALCLCPIERLARRWIPASRSIFRPTCSCRLHSSRW